MDLEMGDEDLLSDLPQSIIESILIRMPILEAVKSCILSSKWRFKWTTIPMLVFDEDLTDEVEEEDIVKFVTHTLLLHKGPIHRLELSVAVLHCCPDMYQWIRYLSRNGIMELVIDMTLGDFWRAPSCLFSCEKLTYLELRVCEIHLPSDFRGFSSLKILILHDIISPPKALEYLISSCPLLETLSMSHLHEILELHIDAPKLKGLTLEVKFDKIIIVHMPLLVSVNFRMFSPIDVTEYLELSQQSAFDKFLGAMPLLERLYGHDFFTQSLSSGPYFGRFLITCNHLAIIELHKVNFEDIRQIEVVAHLLINSPILRTLTISVASLLEEQESLQGVIYWTKESVADATLVPLCHVNLTNLLGRPNELLFVEFLLEQSPAIETLTVSTSTSLEAAKRDQVLFKLMWFRRASPRARIIFSEES